ncbi:MAG TPA: hypothetical protein PK965_12615 [Anaerohalosphaeraceae bacterium]|nr:hypothetical protein [Anaerohalosphaeraceae bacterium]
MFQTVASGDGRLTDLSFLRPLNGSLSVFQMFRKGLLQIGR